MTRRTFLNRLSAAVMGVAASVYAPSCLRALEPVEEEWQPCTCGFREWTPDEGARVYADAYAFLLAPAPGTYVTVPNATYSVPHPTA